MLASTIGFGLLILAIVIQIIFLIRKTKRPDPISHFVMLLASILFFGAFIERSIRINFVAVTNTYETLVLYAGLIAMLLFIYRLIAKERTFPYVVFGGTVVAIVIMAISSSPLTSKEALAPVPALQSHWLVLHVTTAMIGEAFFVVGFVTAILYLATKNDEKKSSLDRLMYISTFIGYILFSAGGLIFAAIWAKVAWGRYWGWDPKETWSLITWITYTAYLHTRLVRKLRGRISAILVITGFIFTMFTIFGVNYILSGLHSYG